MEEASLPTPVTRGGRTPLLITALGEPVYLSPSWGRKSSDTYTEIVMATKRNVERLLSMAPPRDPKRVRRLVWRAKRGHKKALRGPVIVQQGHVVDGQHRLEAILQSGIKMCVTVKYLKGTK